MEQNWAGWDRTVKDEAKRKRTVRSGTIREGAGQRETDIRDRTVMEAMKREAKLVEGRREVQD